ncbi:cobyrinate a,c-diamide synthase [Pseudahrensia aquimaris]|uniref:Hydrogenobyrinate a,c-diamide synthase n=1 Tax=Pseudahrensia aquimaris TaxID=744461 RepID=A0ABW3FJD5_9HYPH
MIAAPHSGSGKTTLTLGLLRALEKRGAAVAPAKAGPDFIDPAFHTFAAGTDCINLDPWAMRPELISALVAHHAQKRVLVVEAMMGLFDGAADGSGSAAELAVMLGLPVVLVVDAAKQSHSIAALVRGFRDHRDDVDLAAVILNKVGSPRHLKMLKSALEAINVPMFGAIMRDAELVLPERHLGLVQAGEHGDLGAFVDHAARAVAAAVDIDSLLNLTRDDGQGSARGSIPPLGQRIAVARDEAFAFCYPHQLIGWQEAGAEILPFSPLGDEGPDESVDCVFLPGGYPELHAGRLAGNSQFLTGLRQVAARGAFIYGECGGYMVLGDGLTDKDGMLHAMAGLLPLTTSFASRKLHLGYRIASALDDLPFGQKGGLFSAHEFHYSTIEDEGAADRLFSVEDALGDYLGPCGLRRDRVMGSYMHLIDRRG